MKPFRLINSLLASAFVVLYVLYMSNGDHEPYASYYFAAQVVLVIYFMLYGVLAVLRTIWRALVRAGSPPDQWP